MKSAGWPDSSIARRISGMRLVTPVEVSLWTTQMALKRWSVSAASTSRTLSGSAPVRQSPGMTVGFSPHFSASPVQRVEKCPVSKKRTSSPAFSVLTSAASHAPVPVAG